MDNDNIIRFFIREPEKEFYVREIARLLKKSPTTISKYLNEYTKEGILLSKKEYNHLFFKANTENKEFKQLKLNHNLLKLEKSGVIDYLEKEFNHPECIILFGSYSKAENNLNSDIDIAVITPGKREIDLNKFEHKIGLKIQLHLYSNKDIENMKTKNKGLLNNLINGIILRGYFEILK